MLGAGWAGAADAPKAGATKPLSPADEKKKLTYADPEKAPADFKVQGEYEGEVTGGDGFKGKIGIQVLALGDGQFHAVFFPGGLPGAGWDGKARISSKNKWGADGKMDGDKTVLEPADTGYSATITGETLAGKTKEGGTIAAKKVVRQSPTIGAKAPEGAVMLFDGSNADAWRDGHMSDRKTLMAGTKTKQAFKSFTLHMEFFLPFKPYARGQDRSNSGLYLQDMAECQVLDSFALPSETDDCGGIYKQHKPLVNAGLPPITWQTYDVEFQAAQWEGDKKVKDAIATIKLNGVVIHENASIKPTPGGGTKENPNGGPIQFQGHGNPIEFRNIWIVEKK